MPTNIAARLPAKRADLTVGPAPYTSPREGELIIRNRAMAVNPLDTIKQISGEIIYSLLTYPRRARRDVASEPD